MIIHTSRFFLELEHVRFAFDPYCRSMLINLKGHGSGLDRDGIPNCHNKCRGTSALCASHKAVPSEPLAALKSLGTAQSQGQPPQPKCWVDTAAVFHRTRDNVKMMNEIFIFSTLFKNNIELIVSQIDGPTPMVNVTVIIQKLQLKQTNKKKTLMYLLKIQSYKNILDVRKETNKSNVKPWWAACFSWLLFLVWLSFWARVTFEYACTTLHTHHPDDREITPIHFHSLSLAA